MMAQSAFDNQLYLKPIEEKYNQGIERVIRSCLIEYDANHQGTAWADPDLGRFSQIYQTPGNQYWVLVDSQDQVVGGTGIGSLDPNQGLCELQKMYLLPDYRGQGYGQRLLNHALDYASHCYQACYLETLDNMVEAQAFYERNGFNLVAQPPVDTGHFLCDVRYLKKLNV